MSEYWKSTPKYWCKFCEAFVKDTKFDKQQHDATPKHQGKIQRSLRNLHKENERADRDKDRAKAEVARLNGIVSGGGSSRNGGPMTAQAPVQGTKSSAEERKRQLQQLADLGVAVPKEYRKQMAMAGDWETVAVRQIKQEDEVKPDVLNVGLRKRKYEGQEEEEEAVETVVRKGWGSTTRVYPGSSGGQVEDIAALMKGGLPEVNMEDETVVKTEADVIDVGDADNGVEKGEVKVEEKQEPTASVASVAPVVFKKRKAKVLK